MEKTKTTIKKILLSFFTECTAVFLSGGLLYCFMEIIWRSYTHITMFFAGGICLLLIYLCEMRLIKAPLFARCILYAAIITAVEFVFGIVFNIFLGLSVWDYSSKPFNILGQICPSYFFLWTALSPLTVAYSHGISLSFYYIRKQFA